MDYFEFFSLPRKLLVDVPALEKQFNAALLEKVAGRLGDFQVDVKLPKFKVTSEFRLDDQLKAMGMVRAFDAQRADFSGMTTRGKLHISAVVHKAFIDLNEEGTERAKPQDGRLEGRFAFLDLALEGRWARHLMDTWGEGESSLRSQALTAR